LVDIGLDNVADEDLMKVVSASCVENETIHNEPVKITPKAVFEALRASDAEGRKRHS